MITEKSIDIIKEELLAQAKLTSRRSTKYGQSIIHPIGLCHALQNLRITGRIDSSTYLHVMDKIRAKQQRQHRFFNCDGYRVGDPTQFLWRPDNLKSRLAFLDKIKKS